MIRNLTEDKQCPNCGQPLPGGALAGLCPVCLLAQGTITDTREAGSPHFQPPPLADIAGLFPQLEVLGLLGAGGMGAVYKARQPALDRIVALKVLPTSNARGGNFAERFNREARALARLSHPNIVAVHEFGQAGSLHYFIMEYVDGANLRQLGHGSRLSPREALQIIPQICDALQYAHDEGVVHRDIKPENVLVDRKGRVKIADFGLAKILGYDAEAARLTAEGQIMGTPHYMAPEQVERPLSVDHRADIYSLGVVFYELLTGDLPLGKFPPPSRKVQVDVRLDEVVLRALENDPSRRYQRASEVKSQVETIAGTPASAPSATAQAEEENAPRPGVRYLRWAGIPVVIERDGEREVNFQGALTAVFVTMLVAAAAHMLVRWLAGTEHAMSRLVWIAAVLTVVWGIRRTLRQPGDAEPQRAKNGTVVLVPRRRFPYLHDALMLVGLFAIVIGSHYFKTSYLALQPTRALPAPQSSLVFTAPTLLTVDEIVDLDIGHTADFPSDTSGINPIAGAAENVVWALAQGFDAVAGVGRLELLSVRLVPITASDWELMTPAAAEARLVSEGTSPLELRPAPDTTPAYAFRTRDSGLGLLRIVEVTGNGQGFVIQLRHAARPSDAPRVQQAKLDPQSNTLRARLPGRGSLELLALRSAVDAAWQRPNGERAEVIAPELASQFDASFPTLSAPGGRPWQMLLRAEHLPAPADHLHFEYQPQPLHRGFTSEAIVPREGPPPGIVSLQALWPEAITNATLRVSVPMAPWHPIGSYEPLSGSRGRTSTGNDPRWNLEMHAAGVGTKGAQLTVVFGTNYPGWNLRVVATRLGQSPVVGLANGSVTNGSAITGTFVFPELRALEEVQNFQVQAQPVEWVDFRNLPLATPANTAQP
jgi:predicted Ser/Thr protein kinase